MLDSRYSSIFQLGDSNISYKKISTDKSAIADVYGKNILVISHKQIVDLAYNAFIDVAHFLRSEHLEQLRSIIDDKEASDNDRFVAIKLMQNANIASGKVLPMCQDTGTAIVMGKIGNEVLIDCDINVALSQGICDAYNKFNLRYSQMSPISCFEEVNTKNNLPAQIDFNVVNGNECNFLFMAKGGGSANKTFLFQKTPAILNHTSLINFIKEKLYDLGTSACPPYHLAIVIGGLSAEMNLKTVKLASARYLDNLPEKGGDYGQAIRDKFLEQEVLNITRNIGIGAQFGGKYFCHDVRVVRLPRHGASCPIGIGVSCSADRQIIGKITQDGVFLEQLEENPIKYFPEININKLNDNVVNIDLNQDMKQVLATLSQCPVKTRVLLSGYMVVARDLAHSRIKDKVEKDNEMPEYFINYPIYYAGPAKTPEGLTSGSFGPTTAGRMDSYVDFFQSRNASKIMIAKGNRSVSVVNSCKQHGGFYLGSIGGAAADIAQCIKSIDVIAYHELGMEAVRRILVKDFPAFVIIDDKGNDFFNSTK